MTEGMELGEWQEYLAWLRRVEQANSCEKFHEYDVDDKIIVSMKIITPDQKYMVIDEICRVENLIRIMKDKHETGETPQVA